MYLAPVWHWESQRSNFLLVNRRAILRQLRQPFSVRGYPGSFGGEGLGDGLVPDSLGLLLLELPR